VKILLACALLGFLAATPSARADTLATGVLSPDTVQHLCAREGAAFHDFGSDGYGCHSISLMISANTYLRQHGEMRFESVDDE